jgi:hypothetical protein
MNSLSIHSIITIPALIMLNMTACSTLIDMGEKESGTPISTATVSTILPTQEFFIDPFAYCATVGQVDTPDARYTGRMMSDTIFIGYLKAAGLDPTMNFPSTFKQMTVWRCMGNKVYACNFGANIPCNSKANTEETPTQAMLDYCRQFPDNPVIPMSITGHSTIYSWYCIQDTPGILNQIDTVDAAGYQSNNWVLVEPNP